MEKVTPIILSRYKRWRYQARKRGADIDLSPAEWWAIWAPFWELRERLNLRMVRYCGIGSYTVGNVHIETQIRHCQSLAEFRRFMVSRLPEVRTYPQSSDKSVDNHP